MSDSEAINISKLERAYARDLVLAGLAASFLGFTSWGIAHGPALDGSLLGGVGGLWADGAGVALGLVVMAIVQAWSTQRAVRAAARDQPHSDAPDVVDTMAAALKEAVAEMGPRKRGRPKKAAQSEARAEEAPKVTEHERLRERLRAGGFSDDEISEILIARAMQGYTGGSFNQGALTGVLNNLTAVMGHVRNFLPSLKDDLTKMLFSGLPLAARLEAAIVIVLKVSMVAVLGYIVSLEFFQLKAMVDKTRAEACSARMKMIAETLPFSQWPEANAAYEKDCGPHP
jgi:hypothetical protein